jgi:transposase
MATHYVARELAALGHDAKQVPPTYAKPFRQGHKNDFRVVHAVAEAVQRSPVGRERQALGLDAGEILNPRGAKDSSKNR